MSELLANPLLLTEGWSWWKISCLLFLATYLLEDLAIISGALLSAGGAIMPEVALGVLLLGVFSGDIVLYGLGRGLKRMPVLRQWQWFHYHHDHLQRWLQRGVMQAVVIARVIPGIRFPVYTACGFFQVSFYRFFCWGLCATLLWVTLFFGSLYYLEGWLHETLSSVKWFVILGIISCFLLGRYLLTRKVKADL
ncbi:hypothetical protein CI610_01162 [invertebrate metagenome]|uniref:VTT domain-containing protein n=1 Tax=invertebrate metagenome TaxID=1711999 RepID=A0A2H9T9H6_9ZZZZ